METAEKTAPSGLSTVKREWVLGVAIATSLVFAVFGEALLGNLGNPFVLALLLGWLFAVILSSAMGVVRHAEALSERLGEPFGTLVLTISITGIEVMSITAVMLHGENNPELVRDTLFSVVMIIMGGMIGLSLLLGAIRHNEQSYNLQGANAYLGGIIPLAVFSLVLPNVTTSTEGPTLAPEQQIMVGVMAAGLYMVFLMIQTGRNRLFFVQPELAPAHEGEDAKGTEDEETDSHSLFFHLVLLFAYIAPVVFLVEQLAHPIDYIVETMQAPVAIGGVLMAILVVTPEGIGGVKAALNNRLQQSVNILLGSVLATIGLTVPIMLAVSNVLGLDLVLGLNPTDLMLLLLMLAVSIVTFSSGRTHLLQGAVHLLIFAAFLVLLYRG